MWYKKYKQQQKNENESVRKLNNIDIFSLNNILLTMVPVP